MSIAEHDDLEMHCPSLGGEVPFKYCRSMQAGLPCANIVRCWHRRLDIIAFLAANYEAEELEKALGAPRKGRLERLLDILERVKKQEEQSN